MKRIVLLENNGVPPDSSWELIDEIIDPDEDEAKEIYFAIDRTNEVMATLETYSRLTRRGDELILVLNSAFANREQVEKLSNFLLDLPVVLTLYVWDLESFLEDINRDFYTFYSSDTVEVINRLIDKSICYDVNNTTKGLKIKEYGKNI